MPNVNASRGSISVTLSLTLEGAGAISIQIAEQIRSRIENGDLQPGDRLPTSRGLAGDIGVARGTVAAAYDALAAEGVIESRTGSGTFVSNEAALLHRAEETTDRPFALDLAEALVPDIDQEVPGTIDLRPCRPSVAEFPLGVWRRMMADAACEPLSPGYGDPLGPYRLRRVLADYLRRSRGLSSMPEDIIVTNGSVHAMHLFARVYGRPNSVAYVEDPGYPLARQTFELAGAQPVSVPVDADGMMIDHLPAKARIGSYVYVTPSHQFPTGGRLSLSRRAELIDWAEKSDALIIEDDYDGEYRFDVAPLPPLAGIGRGRVLYCGTFSKTMFPGVRIGFATGPRALINAMAAYRSMTEYAPNQQLCSALASFIEAGEFEKHVLRMRRVYRRKRSAVVDAMKPFANYAKVVGLESGLNALVDLQRKMSASRIVRAGQERGVLISPLKRYTTEKSLVRQGVVIGFAAPSEAEIGDALTSLFTDSLS